MLCSHGTACVPLPQLEGKVHYSALSALRNLCLPGKTLEPLPPSWVSKLPLSLPLSPAAHKPLLLEKGVLQAAISSLSGSEWPHVHFKALGIARLLVDKQGTSACTYTLLKKRGPTEHRVGRR